MKNQVQPLLAAVLLSGALLLGLSSQSFGADVADETEEPQAEGFYLHGFIEAGGLIFIDRPPVEERSKFEEYGEVSPGFIVPEVYLEFGSTDGLNLLEFRGTDLTWNNRNAVVEFSRAGRLYLSGEWDEFPHLERSRAWTLFGGVGSDNLTVDDTVQTNLQTEIFAGGGGSSLPVLQQDNIRDIIDGNISPTTVSVDRKTGTVAMRYTPAPAWDINFNYSTEKREGTQALGGNIGINSSSGSRGQVEMPAPIDYTTQNFGASIQYLSDLGNGRKWVTNLAYAGSIFENKYDSVTWENPFRFDYDALDLNPNDIGLEGSALGRHGLPPDNYAHRITLNTSADIAEKTRFTGTVSYNMMRQDETFLPWTANPFFVPVPVLPGDRMLPGMPATSLNGEINTLTINTKLTTRALHPDVTTTASYRYYNNDNDTPDLVWDDGRIRYDSDWDDTVRVSLHPGYVKQNADLDTVWRAHDMATLGLLLGWEQMDRDIGREADVTNEYSAKATADLTPNDWLFVRASALYAERRFDNYDYINRVGIPETDGTEILELPQALMRKYDMSDRDRIKLDLSAEATVTDGLTITGLAGLRYDDYTNNDFKSYDDPFPTGDTESGTELGLKHDRTWHAGVEVNYMADERMDLFASYIHENFDRRIMNDNFDLPSRLADVTEDVDTFTAGVNVELIPNAFDLSLSYTLAVGTEKWIDDSPPDEKFPDVTNNFQRFDAILKYTLPEDRIQGSGLASAFAKIRYAYERNRETNWANDVMPYSPSVAPRSTWLAGLEPNYDAQMVMLTLGASW